MSDVVVADNLTRTYRLGDQVVPALQGVSFTIQSGEFVAIMGASGSGKSTCMHILGCLDQPTSGRYLLDGEAVDALPAQRLAAIRNQKIGFVFQGFNLLPRTSAKENVALPLLYGRVPAAQRRDRVHRALEMVGLTHRADHLPNQLSGGQQQRIAIARALAVEPKLLLADEPTGNLDSRTGEEIMNIFRRLNDQGITIIMVTHDPGLARIASRQITFRDGLVRADTGRTASQGEAV